MNRRAGIAPRTPTQDTSTSRLVCREGANVEHRHFRLHGLEPFEEFLGAPCRVVAGVAGDVERMALPRAEPDGRDLDRRPGDFLRGIRRVAIPRIAISHDVEPVEAVAELATCLLGHDFVSVPESAAKRRARVGLKRIEHMVELLAMRSAGPEGHDDPRTV